MKIGDKIVYRDKTIYTIKKLRIGMRGIQTGFLPSVWIDAVILVERKGVWPMAWFKEIK